MEKNRLYIAFGLVAVLGIITGLAYRTPKSEQPTKVTDPWLKLDKAQATRLLIKRTGQGDKTPAIDIELEKKGDKWEMLRPAQGPADQTVVSGALDQLVDLHAKEAVGHKADSHATFEIEDAVAVHVTVQNGTSTIFDVLVGKEMANGTALRMPGGTDVLKTDRFLNVTFSRNADAWRDKVITNFDRVTVRSVSWTNASGTYAFNRKDDTWTVAGAPIERLDTAKLNQLITDSLLKLSAEGFAGTGETGGIDATSPSVTITRAEGAPVVLRVGSEKDGYVFAKREDSTVVFKISVDKRKALDLKLEEIQAPAPPPAPLMGDGGMFDSDGGLIMPSMMDPDGGILLPSMGADGGLPGTTMVLPVHSGDASAPTMNLEQLPPEIRAAVERMRHQAFDAGAH